ncbi:hypothetical protein TWF569_002899 [Orbilia oligospora]|uniref:Uncharacterized protein n=1 Tax=Orbilia oligospora TaxID=2813651 RepID=A0A7C8JCW8_ORBOL|nr:hypothetical protein TWF706_007472 [Orbilia oligospora]KAF3111507.1 hypothetical protein TWF102_007170 [Orbilia oligospora]KAF3117335.1 hypothetical protein TWF103_007476 [Orbilia oligospora]KAF3140729.1 hypothetical protein TWF594_006229 [Orbilia oligospora]KAF3152593.1 hypothetical protein TWF569_002899 [Orbilia oligospora]
MLAEKRRHQLLSNGTRGFAAIDSADVTMDIDALVKRTHARPTGPTETDWWWKRSLSLGAALQLQQKPTKNLLHVKTVNTVVSLERWPDILEYIQKYPIATGSSEGRRQNRLFVFNTPRSDIPIPFLKWLDDFEKACLGAKHLDLDSWKIFADLIRYQHQAASWHFVWNLDPGKHHRFLMTKQPSGPLHAASFAISMTELLLLSTRLPTLRRSGFTWRPTWPTLNLGSRSPEQSDLSSDHRLKFRFAPKSTPAELLLSLESQIITKRPLLYVKHVALDIAYDPVTGCIVDITTSDVADHINLLPLLYKRDFQPIDLVVRLFDQEVDRWTAFIRAYGSHIKALRTYLYDNRVQKATINTILASLKLVDSLLLIAQNNVETIDQFLSPDVYNQKPNLPYFWMWRKTPPVSTTSRDSFAGGSSGQSTRVNTGDTGESSTSTANSSATITENTYTPATPAEMLLEHACPAQYNELVRDKEYFMHVQDVLKGWEVDLRGQMQLIFNLISIDEAYRSREQNTSLKRLSWITFIFLPMLFMSSLFGMNVDLLANNPEWWWYLVWTIPCLILVMLFWFLYRIWDQRRIAEEELPFKIA